MAVLGAIGEDGFGVELTRALDRRNIFFDLVSHSKEIETFTSLSSLRQLTGKEDQPRTYLINTVPLLAPVEHLLLDRVRQVVEAFDVILISDQAEISLGGVITPALDLLAGFALKYPEKMFLLIQARASRGSGMSF